MARLPAVADITFYGEPAPGPQLRLDIDPDKLGARGLTTTDVMRALQEQNVQAAAGPIGRPPIALPGRLQAPEKLGDIILKAGKDVARVELVAGWSTVTSLDGKPGVFLLVHRSTDADARGTAKAVRARLAELAKKLPAGIDFRVVEGAQ